MNRLVKCGLYSQPVGGGSVGDLDLKDLHHLAGSGSIIFYTIPDPDQDKDPYPDSDLKLAHFPHPFPHHSHLIIFPYSHCQKTLKQLKKQYNEIFCVSAEFTQCLFRQAC